MSSLVNGYVVVELTDSDLEYLGVDRDPWGGVSDAYYAGTLPEALQQSFSGIASDESSGLWWPTSRSRDEAATLGRWSREQGAEVDILAVWSPYLAQSVVRSGWNEPLGRFLGYDVVSVGEWSLLRVLLEAGVDLCTDIQEYLNEAGLVIGDEVAPLIDEEYRRFAQMGVVEQIADRESGVPVEAVATYLVEGMFR